MKSLFILNENIINVTKIKKKNHINSFKFWKNLQKKKNNLMKYLLQNFDNTTFSTWQKSCFNIP